MLDAAMLARVSECYSAAASTQVNQNLPFGGKDIVIIGDLLQLPPISKYRLVKPLYDDMIDNAFEEEAEEYVEQEL